MKRALKFLGLVLAGLLLVMAAWLIPAHVRAVSEEVLERGRGAAGNLVDAAEKWLRADRFGLVQHALAVLGTNGVRVDSLTKEATERVTSARVMVVAMGGADEYLETQLLTAGFLGGGHERSAMRLFLNKGVRRGVLQDLQGSGNLGVRTLLRNRELQGTSRLPAVGSAMGQPLEAAIVMTALLHQEQRFQDEMRDAVEAAAGMANEGGDPEIVEQLYVDMLALARRLDWGTLSALVGRMTSLAQLRDTSDLLTRVSGMDSELIVALMISERVEPVLKYALRYGRDGLSDLGYAMTLGGGSLQVLLVRQLRLHQPMTFGGIRSAPWIEGWIRGFLPMPVVGLYFKYLMTFAGGFLLLVGIATLFPAPTELERRLIIPQYRAMRTAALSVLLTAVLVLSMEPYLFEKPSLDAPMPMWRFPMAGTEVISQITEPLQSHMNKITIVALILFLLVQGVLYVVSLLKVAEIKRQSLGSRLKLRLLDNEEHMFDAGLYVGLGGTVLSLVFLAMGVVKPSLMAAYSSTLFGIVFVGVLKICHVRPYRRRLILEVGENE